MPVKKLLWLLVPVMLLAAVCGFVMVRYDWAVDDLRESRTMDSSEMLYTSLMDEQEAVCLLAYELDPAALSDLWNHTIYDHADLFHIADQYEYVMLWDRVIYVMPRYAVSGQALDTARQAYDRALAHILSTVDDSWTDLETALYLHDYLCMNYAYDESVTKFSAYELLTQGTGVCQAYTLVYSALLNACGIPCDYVISGEMNHSWNVVTLNGQSYNVDITYDDPTADRLGRAVHTNFLKSDTAFTLSHSYTQEEGWGRCTDSSLDKGVWNESATGFVPLDDSFYYISKGRVYRWNEGTSPKAVFTIYATWYTNRGDGSYWEGNHSTLASTGDRLLYNTPYCIMSLDPRTGNSYAVYTYYGSGGIYGFTYDDGLLTLQVSESPNHKGELIPVEIDL